MGWREVLLPVAVCAPFASAQDEVPGPVALDELAFVELSAKPSELVRGQRVELVVRFGVEREFLEQRALPLMRRDLDLPVQLVEPWAGAVDGLVPLPAEPSARATLSVAWHDGAGVVAAEADRVVDGRAFAVYVARRPFRVEADVELPAARLRVAYATRVQTDVFGNVVATDRREGEVVSAARRLAVRPVPERGRPPGFSGAVGRFEIEARLSHTALSVGEPFELWLEVRGPGDLSGFAPPDLSDWEHLHVLGVRDERGPELRRLRYELTPTSPELTAVPALPFTSYDPGPPAHWRTVVTDALPVEVGGEAQAAATDEARDDPGQGLTDPAGAVDGAPGERGGAQAWSPLWAAALGLVLLVAGYGLGRAGGSRRRGGEGPDAPSGRAPEVAPASGPPSAPGLPRGVDWRARLEAGEEPETLLLQALATCSGLPEAALIDPALEARLRRRGLSAELAARAARLVEAATAARYGPGRRLERGELEALLGELPTAP